jgi:hypothetical protein
MRQRRAGDPSSVGKPGRKKSPERLSFEASGMRVGVDMSPRTFARFKQAMEMLREVGSGAETKQSIEAAIRPNGKLNVSRLLEIAFKRYVVRCDRVSQSEAQRLWKFWKFAH